MTNTHYNTPLQNQQIALAKQRRKIENEIINSKVKANRQKGIIDKPVLSNIKKSKEEKKQHQQRIARLNTEAKNSDRISKAIQMVAENISEPVQDTRTFAEKQADEMFQQSEGLKNVNQLISDKGEANKLLKVLIENDLLFDFNNNFPRIFREIKSNYGNVGSRDAFIYIRKILKDVSNQDIDKPLNNKNFVEGIERIITKLSEVVRRAQNPQAREQANDWLNRIRAFSEVSSQISEEDRAQLHDDSSVSAESLSELESMIEQGEDISENSIISAVGDGILNEYAPSETESTTSSQDFQRELNNYVTGIEKMLNSDDPAEVDAVIDFIHNSFNLPKTKIRGWLRGGSEEVVNQIVKYATANRKREAEIKAQLESEQQREFEEQLQIGMYQRDRDSEKQEIEETRAKNKIADFYKKNKERQKTEAEKADMAKNKRAMLDAVKKRGEDMEREERQNYEMGKEDVDVGTSAPKRYFRDKINGLDKMAYKYNVMQFYFFLLTEFRVKHVDDAKNVRFSPSDPNLLEDTTLPNKYTLSQWKAFVKNLLLNKYDGRFDMENWSFDPAPLTSEPKAPLTTRSGREYKP